MDKTIIFLLAAIIIIGALLLAFIGKMTSNTCSKRFNVERYRIKYLEIENHLNQSEPHTFQISILNADKLLDEALRDCGTKGDTMGERLRNSTAKIKDCNSVWLAHKLRNRIAHETDVRVSYEEAKAALYSFRKALKDLGAI